MVRRILVLSAAFLAVPGDAAAALPGELAFALGTLSFLFWGALVMWMCAGFTMLEAGSVATRNASTVCLKNIGLYSIAGLTFYLYGYGLMFGAGQMSGALPFRFLHQSTTAEQAVVAGAADRTIEVVTTGHAAMSGWFFQMVFVASACSIVSGTLAERVKLLPFFIFITIMTTIIYPVVGSWTWGGGWLFQLGFKDFAGATVVHSTGGWCALAGAIVVGARRGKFRNDGTVKVTPPNNVPIVTLGIFIIWFGFIGFNGGSRLTMGADADAVAVGLVVVNTNLAAAAGTVTALLLSRPVFGRIDLLVTLNGAVAGLVAITAAPDITEHNWAIAIGAAGACCCLAARKLLEWLKVDDEVGAIATHMGAGIWGTLAVCIAAGGSVLVQWLGVVAVGVFAFGVSISLWRMIDVILGARIAPDVETIGQDRATLGIETYPEFVSVDGESDGLERSGEYTA